MSHNRALERAILAQIAYLTTELERIRAGAPAAAADAGEPAAPDWQPFDDDPMTYALRDPGFRRWMLQQQLEQR